MTGNVVISSLSESSRSLLEDLYSPGSSSPSGSSDPRSLTKRRGRDEDDIQCLETLTVIQDSPPCPLTVSRLLVQLAGDLRGGQRPLSQVQALGTLSLY